MKQYARDARLHATLEWVAKTVLFLLVGCIVVLYIWSAFSKRPNSSPDPLQDIEGWRYGWELMRDQLGRLPDPCRIVAEYEDYQKRLESDLTNALEVNDMKEVLVTLSLFHVGIQTSHPLAKKLVAKLKLADGQVLRRNGFLVFIARHPLSSLHGNRLWAFPID